MLIPYFPNPFSLKDYYYILSDDNKNFNLNDIGFNKYYQFVSSASKGIYLLLKSFNVEPESKVGLSPLLCNSVTDAILNAGHIPYYFDIDKNYLLDFDEQSFNRSGIRILILPHLYGSLHSYTAQIVNWCKQNKVYLISDTAQSFGLTFNNKPAIEIGEGGVYSFGFGKASSCAGGALVYNLKNNIDYKDNAIINKINLSLSKYKLAKRTFGLETYKKTGLLNIFRNYAAQIASRYEMVISRIQFNSIKKFLENLEEIQIKRINNYSILKNNLDSDYFIIPESFEDSLKFKYVFSLNMDNGKISDFTSSMKKNGIEIHPCSRTSNVYTKDKKLPNYHTMNNRLLEISTEASIPTENYYKASDIMNKYLKLILKDK